MSEVVKCVLHGGSKDTNVFIEWELWSDYVILEKSNTWIFCLQQTRSVFPLHDKEEGDKYKLNGKKVDCVYFTIQ